MSVKLNENETQETQETILYNLAQEYSMGEFYQVWEEETEEEEEPRFKLFFSEFSRREGTGILARDYIAYAFFYNGKLLFAGDDFGPPPGWAHDSNESIGALLGFLSLRPGDTDDDYFAKYTQDQMDFCQSWDCEELSYYAYDLEYEGMTL